VLFRLHDGAEYLKIEVGIFSETLINFYQIARRYTGEESDLHLFPFSFCSSVIIQQLRFKFVRDVFVSINGVTSGYFCVLFFSFSDPLKYVDNFSWCVQDSVFRASYDTVNGFYARSWTHFPLWIPSRVSALVHIKVT
jgi:hypothetical protein